MCYLPFSRRFKCIGLDTIPMLLSLSFGFSISNTKMPVLQNLPIIIPENMLYFYPKK